MSNKPVHIIVTGGFLGSGKTTVLLKLAEYLAEGSIRETPVAVIENEVSMTDVDSWLLRSGNLSYRTLSSGCICCTSSGLLLETVEEVKRTFDPAYMIIEATGLAYPDAVKEILTQQFDDRVSIVTIVDAKRWEKLSFAMPDFVNAQLKEADRILINKTDLVSAAQAEKIRQMIEDRTGCEKIFTICALEPIPEDAFAGLRQ